MWYFFFQKTSGGHPEVVGRRTTRKIVGRGIFQNNRNIFRIFLKVERSSGGRWWAENIELSLVGGYFEILDIFIVFFFKTSGGPPEDVGRRTTRKVVGRGENSKLQDFFSYYFLKDIRRSVGGRR